MHSTKEEVSGVECTELLVLEEMGFDLEVFYTILDLFFFYVYTQYMST